MGARLVMARDNIQKHLTKTDLERVLAMVEVFDVLKTEKVYRLYELATAGKTLVKAEFTEILTSLKVVNNELKLLDIAKTETTKDGFRYLYSKSRSSEQVKSIIIAYANAHYSTPLENLKKPKVKSLYEFLV